MIMDLKREIGLELRRDWPEKKTIEHLLGLFNVWLREQDARNPDGDELRTEEE